MAESRSRDRASTEKMIVESAKRLLRRDGFGAFGVNALAREAGCDKQLIYRYFDGVDGVVDAVGKDLADWVRERMRPLLALAKPRDYRELIERLSLGLLDAYRDDPLMRRLKAWELVDPTPQLMRLSQTRGRELERWMAEARGDLVPPDGIDAPAVNALLIAAIEGAALAAAASGTVNGMPASSEADWGRMRRSLKALIAGVYRSQ